MAFPIRIAFVEDDAPFAETLLKFLKLQYHPPLYPTPYK